jgi:hypothetical protein
MKLLYKALAEFQQSVPPIYKGTEGYGYSYADWGQILEVINPLLKKHGLGFTQPLDGTKLKTIVFHIDSGEAIESSVDIPQDVALAKMNTFQVMGSAITYYKRYSLSAMLGLVTDKDADAAGEQVKNDRKANTDFTTSGADQEILARAKDTVNKELEKQGYTRPDTKKAFIKQTLEKETVDTLNDCDSLMDALENEK